MTMLGDNAVTLVYNSKSRTGAISFGQMTDEEVAQMQVNLFGPAMV